MLQQVLELNAEVAALYTEIQAAVVMMAAATAESGGAMYTKVYDSQMGVKAQVSSKTRQDGVNTSLAGWTLTS